MAPRVAITHGKLGNPEAARPFYQLARYLFGRLAADESHIGLITQRQLTVMCAWRHQRDRTVSATRVGPDADH